MGRVTQVRLAALRWRFDGERARQNVEDRFLYSQPGAIYQTITGPIKRILAALSLATLHTQVPAHMTTTRGKFFNTIEE